jgi:hypothetical protein
MRFEQQDQQLTHLGGMMDYSAQLDALQKRVEDAKSAAQFAVTGSRD